VVQGLEPGDPQRIGPYRLTGRLGSGGMGQVFLGRSPGGRPVALKVIRADLAADQEFRTRFRHEVEAARRVNGLYTALVVDADVDGPMPWLATAYVTGPSLSEAVKAYGPLPADTVLALAAGLAEGLAAIHAAGVVHRDLKPANVLLADDGPRVIDFGISRAAGGSVLTLTGGVVGSPPFMSPEQAEGRESGPASDVFGLGAVLAFAATGKSPFGTGAVPMVLYRVVHGTPNLDEVPGSIRPLIADCLAKDPRARPSTAGILARIGDIHPGVDWLPGPLLAAIASSKVPDEASDQAVAWRHPATVGSTAPPTGPSVSPLPTAGAGRPEGPGGHPRPRGARRRFPVAAVAAVAAAVAALVIASVLFIPRGIPRGGHTPQPTTSSSGNGSATATGHAAGQASSWSAPRSIDGTQKIAGVSCPSASFCLAVDASGGVTAWNGTTWQGRGSIASGVGVNGVSCSSAQQCAAVTTDGSYFTWNGSSWRGPLPTPGGETFLAIDCLSASFCAAAGAPFGGAGHAATLRGGVWSATSTTYLSSMYSVSCPDENFCLAAGDLDETAEWNGSTWSSAQLQAIFTLVSARASCTSPSFCVLVDTAGDAALWNGAQWASMGKISSVGFSWVSCATASLCAAVTSSGSVMMWNGTSWTSGQVIDYGQGITSVSCPTSSFCVAVDDTGNALVYR
jgi:serine/threonine protein kinase